jgi:hypothetical protein
MVKKLFFLILVELFLLFQIPADSSSIVKQPRTYDFLLEKFKKDSKNSQVAIELANSLKEGGYYFQALDILNEAIHKNKTSKPGVLAKLYLTHASVLTQQGNLVEAKADLKKVEESAKKVSAAHKFSKEKSKKERKLTKISKKLKEKAARKKHSKKKKKSLKKSQNDLPKGLEKDFKKVSKTISTKLKPHKFKTTLAFEAAYETKPLAGNNINARLGPNPDDEEDNLPIGQIDGSLEDDEEEEEQDVPLPSTGSDIKTKYTVSVNHQALMGYNGDYWNTDICVSDSEQTRLVTLNRRSITGKTGPVFFLYPIQLEIKPLVGITVVDVGNGNRAHQEIKMASTQFHYKATPYLSLKAEYCYQDGTTDTFPVGGPDRTIRRNTHQGDFRLEYNPSSDNAFTVGSIKRLTTDQNSLVSNLSNIYYVKYKHYFPLFNLGKFFTEAEYKKAYSNYRTSVTIFDENDNEINIFRRDDGDSWRLDIGKDFANKFTATLQYLNTRQKSNIQANKRDNKQILFCLKKKF